MAEERVMAKVINIHKPGEHVAINFNGKRYGYQPDEECDMPKFIFDYINSIEMSKWVQGKSDRAPRVVKTRKYMAVKVEKVDDNSKKEAIKEIMKSEKRKTNLNEILEG